MHISAMPYIPIYIQIGQSPEIQSFYAFFVIRMNKLLNKQSSVRGNETP